MHTIIANPPRHARSIVPRRIAALVIALSLTGIAACGSDSGTGPSESGPYGTYRLREVGGDALPAQVHNGPWFDPVETHFYNQLNLRVTGGSIELTPTGELTFGLELAAIADGESDTEHSEWEASYKIQGDQLILLVDGQRVPLGTIADDEITISLDIMQKGVTKDYIFRRGR
jgi:hypothetical protein